MDAYDARAVPVYTSELITCINTAHHQELTQINSTRKKLIDHLEKEISYRKKQITDACNEMGQKYTDVILSYNDHLTAIANKLVPTEIDMLCSQKQSLAESYNTERRLYEDRHRQLQHDLASLQKQLTPITLLSAASNQRHFFLTSEDCNMGYNLYKDMFEMVVKNNQPSDTQILRCAMHHPQQKLFNLPLSLLNVLKYSERVGCSNSMLKTLLIIFLTKHQPELVETIDPHSL